MRDTYENIEYMGRVQTFTYHATWESETGGEDLYLYNGEPDENNMAATLTHKTLENLLLVQKSYLEIRKHYQEMGIIMGFDKSIAINERNEYGFNQGIRRK